MRCRSDQPVYHRGGFYRRPFPFSLISLYLSQVPRHSFSLAHYSISNCWEAWSRTLAINDTYCVTSIEFATIVGWIDHFTRWMSADWPLGCSNDSAIIDWWSLFSEMLGTFTLRPLRLLPALFKQRNIKRIVDHVAVEHLTSYCLCLFVLFVFVPLCAKKRVILNLITPITHSIFFIENSSSRSEWPFFPCKFTSIQILLKTCMLNGISSKTEI